jgi:hypothetical protein
LAGKQKSRTTQQENSRDTNFFQEKSKGASGFTTGHSHGNRIHADHQPDPGPERVLKFKRKKKRKGV